MASAFVETFTGGIECSGARGGKLSPCQCFFCDRMVKIDGGSYCSLECAGGVVKTKCYHMHSKCPVVGCNERKKSDFIDEACRRQYTDKGRIPPPFYPQPFCEGHLPKCVCGESRFTTLRMVMKYPLSEVELMKFNPTCSRCYLHCNIPECKEPREYVTHLRLGKFAHELLTLCSFHKFFTGEAPAKLVGLNKNCEIIRGHLTTSGLIDMKLFQGQTLEECYMTAIQLFSGSKDWGAYHKFRNHAYAIEQFRSEISSIGRAGRLLDDLVSKFENPNYFKKTSTLSISFVTTDETPQHDPEVISERQAPDSVIRNFVVAGGVQYMICNHKMEEKAKICHAALITTLVAMNGRKFRLENFKCSSHGGPPLAAAAPPLSPGLAPPRLCRESTGCGSPG
ncbi:MAG: hypothetical protein Hyperionvirus11_68 [Hyperionvirus sp.]|uniref:Uncharacterized protein n=1 Tax=Hyperionvirus sp. TaxID=2487770 RepID=A0A3G5A986_9VIRU|nr:MAG: hypothetical protein Hyperionvirus11_68 [Hyperionvirus sp.]